MRKFSIALLAAFVLGGFAPIASAGCGGHDSAVKNDHETPPPATSSEKSQAQ